MSEGAIAKRRLWQNLTAQQTQVAAHIERIDKTIEQLQLERAKDVQLLEDIAQQKNALMTEIRLVTALKDE